MILETPTPNLQESKEFYNKLDFEIIDQDDNALVSDGTVKILINSDRYTRAGIHIYIDDRAELIEKLSKEYKFFGRSNNIFCESSGTRITLHDSADKEKFQITKTDTSFLGTYAGVCLETPDIEKSVNLWKKLGFEVSMGAVEQGWIALSNAKGDSISLMKPMSCPHLFFNPSLTYFNGSENISIIEKIRQVGVDITEEVTHFNPEDIVDNVILRDPGGLGFFVFSD